MSAASPQHWPQLPPSGDGEAVLRWARGLSADLRAAIAPEFSADAIAAKRKAERDTLIVDLAVTLEDGQRGQARQVHDMLSRYAASAWRFDEFADRPHNPKNSRLWKILRASDGNVLSDSALRRILRAQTGSRKAVAMNQRSRDA